MAAVRERFLGAASAIVLVWATCAFLYVVPPLRRAVLVPVVFMFLLAEVLVTKVAGPVPSPGIDIPMLPQFHEQTGFVVIALVTLAAGSIGFLMGTRPLRFFRRARPSEPQSPDGS
jgi:hypothetical protein